MWPFKKRRKHYAVKFTADDGRSVTVEPDPDQSERSALWQGIVMASKKLDETSS